MCFYQVARAQVSITVSLHFTYTLTTTLSHGNATIDNCWRIVLPFDSRDDFCNIIPICCWHLKEYCCKSHCKKWPSNQERNPQFNTAAFCLSLEIQCSECSQLQRTMIDFITLIVAWYLWINYYQFWYFKCTLNTIIYFINGCFRVKAPIKLVSYVWPNYTVVNVNSDLFVLFVLMITIAIAALDLLMLKWCLFYGHNQSSQLYKNLSRV